MGSIALLRQSYYDAQWYKADKGVAVTNISLDALNKSMQLPQVFEVSDVFSAMRADKIGDEFNIRYIVKGARDEYQRIDEVKSTGNAFIIPLNFPLAYDVEDPFDAQQIPLAAMLHWEMAPGNPGIILPASLKGTETGVSTVNWRQWIKSQLTT